MHQQLSEPELLDGGCCFGLSCRLHVGVEALVNKRMAADLGVKRRQLAPVVDALQSNLVLTTAHLYALAPPDLAELGLPLVARNWLRQLLLEHGR